MNDEIRSRYWLKNMNLMESLFIKQFTEVYIYYEQGNY